MEKKKYSNSKLFRSEQRMVNLIKIIQGFKTHFVKNRNDSIEIKLDFPLSKLDRHDKKTVQKC